jgi:mannosylglucosylglycerate synthase
VDQMLKRIGFVSTRFAGTDGVTLESNKWAEVFEQNGHKCFWFAGKLDRGAENALRVPEAFFQDEQNLWINSHIFGREGRTPQVTQTIHELRSYLKKQLHEFIRRFDIDLLVAENVLAIPMHVPLGLALTETIAETQIPTIAHHHDFFWERVRFSVNAVNDYMSMAFPPHLPGIAHVVINTDAQQQLAHRTGIASSVIPNVLDFENPPRVDVGNFQRFRESIGMGAEDRLVLQPTRIIQRKGIEHSIALVKELSSLQCKLVVSHEAGDEGFEYAEWLQEYACDHQVDLRLIKTSNGVACADDPDESASPCLWDVYPFADFITYPSLYEGFGNAFLEGIYFRKPMLVNRYATFVRDIEPRGFDLALMDGYLSRKTVKTVSDILESPDLKDRMVNHNYAIAARHYSYNVLRHRLNAILNGFFGDDVTRLTRDRESAEPRVFGSKEVNAVPYEHFESDECQKAAAM